MAEPEKKSGVLNRFGKGVKNLLFVSEEGTETDTAEETGGNASGESQPADPPANDSKTPKGKTSTRSAPVNKEIYDELVDAIESKGLAYTQFMTMVNSMKDAIADELTRYKAALVALGNTSKTSVDQILRAIDAKTNALLEERETFTQKLSAETGEVNDLKQEVKDKDKQVAECQKRIEALQKEKQELLEEIGEKSEKIDSVKSDFENALQAVQADLKKDRQKILNYLTKGGK